METNETEYQEEVITEEQPQEEQQQEAPPPPPIPPQYQEDAQERNWREMRKKVERLEKEAEELRQQQLQKQSEPDIDPDEFLTYGQLQKIKQEEEAKRAKQEQERLAKEREAQIEREKMEAPQKLKSQYKDFSDIVTQENINKLVKEDPEIAQSLEVYNDKPYIQGKLAYEIIKARYGQPRYDEYTEKKIQDNLSQPTPSSAIKRSQALSSADAFANGLTPELKEQLWKEMEEYAKG